jgi:outer membrane biosynthesis protein TonB
MTPHYRQSFVTALAGHFLLIVGAILVSVLPGCMRPPPVEAPPVDFMPLRTDLPLQRRSPAPPDPVPPPPGPVEPRNPDMPPDPVPPKPRDRTPEKPPESAPAHAKEPDPVSKERTNKPAPSNAVERARTERVPVKIGEHTVRIVPLNAGSGARSRTPPRLSKGEWDRMFGVHAPLGQTDSVPMDERQQCLIRIKRALYDAWDQPALADSGTRPAELEARFDASGRMVSYRITQSSGSDTYDRSVLLAAKAVPRVEGLTARFLRDYPKWTVEFKLSE